MNLFDDLKQYSNLPAIVVSSSEEISYKTLIDVTSRISSRIKQRDLFFLICSNSLESIAGYLGALRANAVPVLLNKTIDKTFLSALITTYKPRYIFLPKTTFLPSIRGTEIFSYSNYKLFETNYTSGHTLHSDLALLLTTSGSMGSRKLVRQSYNNLKSNALSISQYLGITKTDRPITTLPMSYSYGLSIINSHLLNGATILLTEATMMERSFWEMATTNGATTFGGVPYTYEILNKLRFGDMNIPSLKYLTQAGGHLSRNILDKFLDICTQKDMRFITMYGQTEATSRMSYLPWSFAHSKKGSIGIPIPGGFFHIEDEVGNVIIDANVAGELIFTGSNVTLGYAENLSDLEKGDENHGVLHTGDVAMRDSDGFYFITGRKTRFIKLYGHRLSLDELEQHINASGHECACMGSDDHLRIYLTDITVFETIRHDLVTRIRINPAAFTLAHIDKLPRTESGKIRYSELD